MPLARMRSTALRSCAGFAYECRKHTATARRRAAAAAPASRSTSSRSSGSSSAPSAARPLGHLAPEVARHERLGRRVEEVVDLGPRAAADREDVAEAARRQQPTLTPRSWITALIATVVPWKRRPISPGATGRRPRPAQELLRELRRGRGLLLDRERAGRLVEQRKVDERSADVHGDPVTAPERRVQTATLQGCCIETNGLQLDEPYDRLYESRRSDRGRRRDRRVHRPRARAPRRTGRAASNAARDSAAVARTATPA